MRFARAIAKTRFAPTRVLAFLFLAAASTAHAGLLLETEGVYDLSAMKAESTHQATDIFGGFFAGATIGKAPTYTIGFRCNYVVKNFSAADGAVSGTVSGIEWGPQLGIMFGKGGAPWRLNASYHVYLSGTISENGTSLGGITGSGYQASFGYVPQVTEKLSIGINLVYRGMMIKKLATPSNTVQTVAYSSSGFMPTLFLSFRF